jgi:NAD(P)-dependent dehydrogenase (short-subunit alcohol dehydrogenase family)
MLLFSGKKPARAAAILHARPGPQKCLREADWVTPEDLVGAFVYFASDASLFATGSDLTVDGGYTIV